MKKIAGIVVLIGLLTGSAFFASAQKKFTEGKIIFDIAFPDMDMDQNKMAMLPTDATLYVKKGQSRMEMKMGMGSVISITKGDSTTTLMDMMGRKMAIKMNKEDAKKMKGKVGKPDVKITSETKDIAGYKCTKAIVTINITEGKDKGLHTVNVWFTKDIEAKNSSNHQIEGIDGFMMEFEVEERGVNMKMTARSVDQQPVDDSLFIVPDGYQELKMQDLMKMQGGGEK